MEPVREARLRPLHNGKVSLTEAGTTNEKATGATLEHSRGCHNSTKFLQERSKIKEGGAA